MSILWQPSAQRIENSTMTAFRRWLADEHGLSFADYDELWRWSVAEIESFWALVWDYFGLGPRGDVVLEQRVMPGARWFPGAVLNFAARALDHESDAIAILEEHEDGPGRRITYGQLRLDVGSVAGGMRELGVGRGDRVAAIVSNTAEAVTAMLACASIGAVWTACSPEFGADSVIARFAQVEPVVLLHGGSYRYRGIVHQTDQRMEDIRAGLPTVRHVRAITDLLGHPQAPQFTPLPFDQPLWILYSSGTTGLPKAIVQGHGGIVISALKDLAIQLEVGPSDRFFRFSTPAWVMWNITVSALLTGAAIVLYNGDPLYPDADALWRMAGRLGVTNFGAGAAWIEACRRAGVKPRETADLTWLKTVASTGSPLSPEGFRWLYREVGSDLHVASNCGGTDVCGPLLCSCALLPVRAGEIQTRPLGVATEAWSEDGVPLIGEIGELVVTQPVPSMPLFLWGDRDGSRLHDSYFDMFPGVWRHGDWVKITADGGAVVHGRSDATLNRGGVRMGTAEFYAALETVDEVRDALVVDTSHAGAGGELVLFAELAPGAALDAELDGRIRGHLRSRLSPRHVPDRIIAVPAIPYTLTGKRCEVLVKRLLAGESTQNVIARDVLRDPDALDSLLAALRRTPGPSGRSWSRIAPEGVTS